MQEYLDGYYWWGLDNAVKEILASHEKLESEDKIGSYSFSGMGIGLQGLRRLESKGIFKCLHKIDLQGNKLGDAGISELANILKKPDCSVTWIHLGYNDLTFAGVESIAGALLTNKRIVSLHFQGNNVGDRGALALAKMLLVNTALLELHLNGTHSPGDGQISSSGAEVLVDALVPSTARRHDSPIALESGAESRCNVTLQQLNFWGNSLGDTGIQHIERLLIYNNTIIYLGLGRNQFTSVGMGYLAAGLRKNKSVISIDMRNNACEDTGLRELADALEFNDTLLSVGIMCNGITTVGIRYLLERLRNTRSALLNMPLRHVDISRVDPTGKFKAAKSYFKWAGDFFGGNGGFGAKAYTALEYMLWERHNKVDEQTERELREKLLDSFTSFLACQEIPSTWLKSPEEFIKQFPHHAALRGVKQIIAMVIAAFNRETLLELLSQAQEKHQRFRQRLREEGVKLIHNYEELQSHYENLQKHSHLITQEKDALHGHAVQLVTNYEEINAAFETSQRLIHEKSEIIKILRTEIDELSRNVKPVSSENIPVDQLLRQNEQLKSKVEALEEVIKLQRKYLEQADSQLRQMQSKQSSQVSILPKAPELLQLRRTSIPTMFMHTSGTKRKDEIKTAHEDSTIALSRKLVALNATGNDQNLAQHGHRMYWYSIGDGFRLLVAIRKKCLNYAKLTGENYSFKSNGEEYSYYRENRASIFIGDPYITENFDTAFIDDIRTITGGHTGETVNRNNTWEKMPTLLILAILTGNHWRAIRIQIDYATRNVSILWDDPYGKDQFDSKLRESIILILKIGIDFLFTKQLTTSPEHINYLQCEKSLDQQGRGRNGWDCGVIIFANIYDYTRSNVANSEFASMNARFHYRIKMATESAHESLVWSIRGEHCTTYAEIDGISLPMQERLNSTRKIIERQYEQFSYTIKVESMRDILSVISSWEPDEISKIFSHLEVLRSNRDVSERHYPYKEQEFITAYDFVRFQIGENERLRLNTA